MIANDPYAELERRFGVRLTSLEVFVERQVAAARRAGEGAPRPAG